MKVKFKNLAEIEQFAKVANLYDGDVIVKSGSITIDGESVVGLVTLGVNKWVEVYISNEDSQAGRDFRVAIRQLGINTKGND